MFVEWMNEACPPAHKALFPWAPQQDVGNFLQEVLLCPHTQPAGQDVPNRPPHPPATTSLQASPRTPFSVSAELRGARLPFPNAAWWQQLWAQDTPTALLCFCRARPTLPSYKPAKKSRAPCGPPWGWWAPHTPVTLVTTAFPQAHLELRPLLEFFCLSLFALTFLVCPAWLLEPQCCCVRTRTNSQSLCDSLSRSGLRAPYISSHIPALLHSWRPP